MKEIVSSVTQRGQVTIPAEVRKRLGLKARDKVVFQIQDDQIRLAPARFTLETAYGSVKPRNKPENFKEIAREAKEEHVEQSLRKTRKT